MNHDQLELHYRAIESRYSITASGKYSTLVTANGNSAVPIHRWFRMKEAYSNRLLERVLGESGLSSGANLDVIDPFSGSGTTGVSAGDLVREGKLGSASVTALEVNPFLHLVSRAKMNGHVPLSVDLRKIAGEAARRAMSSADGYAPVPNLSTFSNAVYFPEENLRALLALKASLDRRTAGSPDEATLFMQVALAAAIEPSSNLRRDGRALRLAAGKAANSPIDIFLGVVDAIAEDISRKDIDFRSDVILADSREVVDRGRERFDLALFSPPYPNNIDYTEVYKLEGWFLGLYTTAHEFSNQRRRSLRSHSSLRWGDTYDFRRSSSANQVEELLAPVVASVPKDQYRRGREEVVLGYADDMFRTIRSMFDSLKPRGVMAIVVGNSMHGKTGHDYVIASDLILARLAELAGFRVERIEVARYPKRRTARSSYLRESVVMARKE